MATSSDLLDMLAIPTPPKSTNLTISHSWKIPSISLREKYLLCHGFIRLWYNKHMVNDIIQLLAEHYYTKDTFTLDDIKNASSKDKFITPLVTIKSLKFYLQCYPNGYSRSTDGSIIIFACLASFPPQISKLNTKCTIIIDEINKETSKHVTFTATNYWVRLKDRKLKLAHIKDLDTLTFTFKIQINSIIDINHKSIPNFFDNFNTNPIQLPVANCNWQIADKFTIEFIHKAVEAEKILSPCYKFGPFTFYLRFYPKRKGNAELFLVIPCFPNNVSQIAAVLELCLKETKSTTGHGKQLFNSKCQGCTWKSGTLTNNDIKDLNEFTFAASVIVHEVYDIDKNIIINFIEKYALTYPKVITLPFKSYEWNISKLMTTNKDPVLDKVYDGNVITLGIFKFCLRIIPNSSFMEATRKGPKIGIRIIWLPADVLSLMIKIRFWIVGTHFMQHKVCNVKYNFYCSSWYVGNISVEQLINSVIHLDLSVANVEWKNDNDNDTSNGYYDIERFEFNEMCLFPMVKYEWKICDKDIIKQIHDCVSNNYVTSFKSNVFMAYGLKWCLSFYPNSSRVLRRGSYNLFLNLITFPNCNFSIGVQYNLKLIEKNVSLNDWGLFQSKNTCWGIIDDKRHPLNTNDIKLLNTFTFQVTISLIEVYDNHKIITDKFVNNILNERLIAKDCNSLMVDTYSWIINSNILNGMKYALIGERFESPKFIMHGMVFKLICYPNGKDVKDKQYVNIYLEIENIFMNSNVSIVCVECTINIIETNTRTNHVIAFYDNYLNDSWGIQKMGMNELLQLEHLTIVLTMELAGIYDYMQKDITNLFINDNKLKDINNNLGIKCIESEENMLRIWCCNELGLPEYYDLFLNQGIDNLNMLKLLTINELDEMNIKIEHKTLILLEICKLNAYNS